MENLSKDVLTLIISNLSMSDIKNLYCTSKKLNMIFIDFFTISKTIFNEKNLMNRPNSLLTCINHTNLNNSQKILLLQHLLKYQYQYFVGEYPLNINEALKLTIQYSNRKLFDFLTQYISKTYNIEVDNYIVLPPALGNYDKYYFNNLIITTNKIYDDSRYVGRLPNDLIYLANEAENSEEAIRFVTSLEVFENLGQVDFKKRKIHHV